MRFLLSFLENLTPQAEFIFQKNGLSWADLKDFDDNFVCFITKLDKITIKFCNVAFNFFRFCSIFFVVLSLHFNKNASCEIFFQKLYFSK